jgi:glycerol-3-phosphate dehydrogenase
MKQTESRKSNISRLKQEEFDVLVIGGGATGSGTALDAQLRGLKVALIDKADFASGTSSRSTKLIHGGVRYLAQFHFKLIREALSERSKLLQNAPHLVKPMKFVMPTYKFYEKPYYSIGLTLYDLLAWGSQLPKHKRASVKEVTEEFSSIQSKGLKGGITYYDAQFNDSRLNIATVRGASENGAAVVSRIQVIDFIKDNGLLKGAKVRDLLTNEEFEIKAKTITNTTGVWIDEIRKIDDPNSRDVLSPSQGIHLVFTKDKIQCKSAMIIPKTSDGRVVFIIPWEDYVIMGTTDTNVDKIEKEPLPLHDEVDFLLKTGNEYLNKKLYREDIHSVFSGLRPLISLDPEKDTKNISREEMILVSPSNLITMSGGKWSTYRKMGEDLTDKIIEIGKLSPKSECKTHDFSFPGKEGYSHELFKDVARRYSIHVEIGKRLQNFYGGEVYKVLGDKPKELLKNIGYFEEEVVFAVKNEFALSTLDILARRFRILFLDLEVSSQLVDPVSQLIGKTLDLNDEEVKNLKIEANELISKLKGSIQA